MGAIRTGADFGYGCGVEDLDRAARGKAEEAVEATPIRQCALVGEVGEGHRRETPVTPRGCGSGEQEGAKT